MFYHIAAIFGCMVVLPFILEKIKIPEPIMLIIVLYIECSSMTISAFVPELWQFHLSYSVLGMLNFCKYSLTMSMISKVRISDIATGFRLFLCVLRETRFTKMLKTRFFPLKLDFFPPWNSIFRPFCANFTFSDWF